jgi:hypothetical protein
VLLFVAIAFIVLHRCCAVTVIKSFLVQ